MPRCRRTSTGCVRKIALTSCCGRWRTRNGKGSSMTGREIIEALHHGRRVFASAVVGISPQWPALAKQTGIDFVFVDTEHVPLDRQTLSSLCQTYQALGLPPVVRIPCN